MIKSPRTWDSAITRLQRHRHCLSSLRLVPGSEAPKSVLSSALIVHPFKALPVSGTDSSQLQSDHWGVGVGRSFLFLAFCLYTGNGSSCDQSCLPSVAIHGPHCALWEALCEFPKQRWHLWHTPVLLLSAQCLRAAMSPGTLHPELSTSAMAPGEREKDTHITAEHLEAEPLCVVC